jgi:hypothetical protein
VSEKKGHLPICRQTIEGNCKPGTPNSRPLRSGTSQKLEEERRGACVEVAASWVWTIGGRHWAAQEHLLREARSLTVKRNLRLETWLRKEPV